MPNKITITLASAMTAAVLFFTTNASATVVGDTVNACWTIPNQLNNCLNGNPGNFNAFNPGAPTNGTGSSAIVVDAGFEFEFFGTVLGGGNQIDVGLDVDDGTLLAVLRYVGSAPNFVTPAAMSVVLWDLDWLDVTGQPVPGELTSINEINDSTGVIPLPQIGNFGPLGNFISISIPANIFLINVAQLPPNQVSALAEWEFEARHVPEPGTLALFGLGLAGLGLARRRKAA